MAEIINLRTARKAKARTDAATTAAQSRALHGRTLAQKRSDRAEAERQARMLDGARIDE
ncbi:DUF4169 family protein [Sphingomonas sp. H39-1-10]|uniref:DUF4169 family protein n=2 Tax=Sphingomonas TaxID=13687 RepID=UPI000882E32C|nr:MULTISPECIES: DUF4169 family protein [Sphingomonas]MDF0489872.1 DUF4169 family protein [Sphingomonas pollutisoli]SDA32096.1 protein of unknown function [Sphingomonas sp. NFR15]